MSAGEHTPTLPFDHLTGVEMMEISEALGRPVEEALKAGSLMIGFALEWQARKRAGDEAFTFKDACELPLSAVRHHLDAEVDPT